MITIDVLDRAYAKKLASGIKSITVNSTNDGLYFVTNSGTSFDVKLPNFHSHSNLTILEKFSFDSTNNQLLYDGQPIASGSSGTTNYEDLINKPSINGVKLTGDKTLSDLGLLYEKEITTTSSTWSIQHNLNTPWYQLSINIIDTDNNIVFGDIDVANSTNNLLVIKFNTPIAGKIILKK